MLELQGLPLHIPAALDAVCAAQAALNLPDFCFTDCGLGPASVPALVRLICGDKCRGLTIRNGNVQLLDEAAGTLLAGALAASSMTNLCLHGVDFWQNVAAATAACAAGFDKTSDSAAA